MFSLICIRLCTCEMPCPNRTLIIINNLIDASRSRTSSKQQSREDIGKINGRHLARNNCVFYPIPSFITTIMSQSDNLFKFKNNILSKLIRDGEDGVCLIFPLEV